MAIIHEREVFVYMEEKIGEIKQIIIITDGKSNIGKSPVDAALDAYKRGITVSAIGIVDNDGSGDERDVEELEGIAKAGGGLCEYTHIQNLGMTMQIMTQKTAQKTLEQIVSRQLKSIVGTDINEIEPKSRYKIVDFIEKYGDKVNLKCVIALDTSGSMKYKLESAKQSLLDLLQSMKCRQGQSSIAVVTYPGQQNDVTSIVCKFTDNGDTLESRIRGIKAGGGTPTGPAIETAVNLILDETIENEILEKVEIIKPEEEIKKYYV